MSKESLNEARLEFEKACDEHVTRNGRNAKVYISGPMSNLTREQYLELFMRAEQALRDQGYQNIVNPIRVWSCRWPWLYRIVGYRLTLLYDLWLLMRCDQIYKLPGWRDSRGASIESCVAYHMKVWPMSKDVVQKIDKPMEKLIIKFEKSE